MNDLFTWQIGSQRPPNVCLCCGLAFDEAFRRIRGPYRTGPYIWVCESCWSLPFLFFPDKIDVIVTDGTYVIRRSGPPIVLKRDGEAQRVEALRLYTPLKIVPQVAKMDIMELPAIRLEQKGMHLYAGKAKARDLLWCQVRRWSEQKMDWYQRERYQERTAQVLRYVKDCPIAVIPSIILGSDQLDFKSNDGDVGMVAIPRDPERVRVIDGQHRLGGFELCKEKIQELEESRTLGKLSKAQEELLKEYRQVLEHEIPVLIMDSEEGARLAQKAKKRGKPNVEITPENAERVVFFLQNKTQKGINPNLEDQLQYRIWYSGIDGIPAIDEEVWRAHATRLVNRLNDVSLALKESINLGGTRGSKRPVRLSSFVSSLKPLYDEQPDFYDPNKDPDEQFEAQYQYVENYWSVLREVFPSAFDDPRSHLLLRALSVKAVNRLGRDIFHWIQEENLKPSKESMRKYLKGLEAFKWGKKESPIRGFGGEQGAFEAYKVLLKHMYEKGHIKEAGALLKEIEPPAAQVTLT